MLNQFENSHDYLIFQFVHLTIFGILSLTMQNVERVGDDKFVAGLLKAVRNLFWHCAYMQLSKRLLRMYVKSFS